MTRDDGFTLDNLKIDGKTSRLAAGSEKLKRRTEKGVEFVMLPYEQTLAAAGHMKCAVLAVMVELAYQMFRTKSREVRLSNSTLRPIGISYKAKLHALRQLEADGMVKVAWSGKRRSPRVTVLWNWNRI